MEVVESVERAFEGDLFSVEVLTVRDADGSVRRREVVRHPGAVVVVPVIRGSDGRPDQLVMINNRRIAVGRQLWEFPAGKLEPNEDPEHAAARELEEETGYQAATLSFLGHFFSSPGFADERMRVFLAESLRPGPQRLQPGENIEVEPLDVDRVQRMIIDGTIEDAKTIAAMYLWRHRRAVDPAHLDSAAGDQPGRARRAVGSCGRRSRPMSWRDRDPHEDAWRQMGRPGGDWQGLRPTLDNPMTWALPLGRVSGIRVRIHILFVLLIVIMLLRSLAAPGEGETFSLFHFKFMAVALLCLFTIVLVHEFGHCLSCRWTGGAADEILMWPLGGLAYCRPERRWSSHLATALGGPAVNVLFCLVSGTILGVLTGQWLGVALPNPFRPYDALIQFDLNRSWVLISLFLINWTSLVLLLFNLLPLFPLDGGRIAQALLWPHLGYVRSMRMTVRIGYLGAIGLGLWGAVIGNWILLGIAVFGGVTCYLTHKQLEYTEQVMGEAVYAYPGGVYEEDADADGTGPSRRQRRQEQRALAEAIRQQQEQAELDRILEQISKQGMNSLSTRQRRTLKRSTERRRTR